MVSHPETDSDSPIGSDRDRGRDSSSAPLRCSIASPRRICQSCFDSSLPLILTIIHWINEGHNK